MSKKEETAMTVQQPGALATRPEYLNKYAGEVKGTEHLTKDDLKMPRIVIAQKASPQVEEGDPKFIEGLSFGDLFNDLTGEVYGRGPLQFTVIRAEVPRAIEFYPFDEGGGVKDLNVPMTDPRTRWHGDNPPAATVFYDYLIGLLPTRDFVVLSMKTTNLKIAKTLNSLMSFRNLPTYCGLYELSTAVEKNDKGSYGVFRVRNAGWTSEEDAEWGKSIFELTRGREIHINREGDDVVEGATPAAQAAADKKSPF